MSLKQDTKQLFVDYYKAYDPENGEEKANKIIKQGKNISDAVNQKAFDMIFTPTGFFVGGYIALTVAANAIYIPIQTGIELLQTRDVKTINAKLTELKHFKTGRVGDVYTGEFTTENGQKIVLYDQPQFFEGKLWGNNKLSKLEEGKEYTVKISKNNYAGIFEMNNLLDAKKTN
ncbi:hypothetical protein K9L97_00255 [Candidatus Woesearchaeota archaeon]|nr:hypothetical protein [Candidatus Woesearchaeota archaeon]